jgi:transposase
VSHANAALTPRARLKVGQLVVDQNVPIREVAARFQCSWPTVKRWATRYADGQPMTDRKLSSQMRQFEAMSSVSGVLSRAGVR